MSSKQFFFKRNNYVFLAFLLSAFSLVHARIINFDAEFGNSGNIADKIQTAIDGANNGDVILFQSSFYDLGGQQNILISKPITFRGGNPVGFNASFFGASGIQTTLGNTATFAVRSNNVKFENISLVRRNQGEGIFDILIDTRHTTYLDPVPESVQQLSYTGLEFDNVVLSGGAYAVHSGNGAGITMNNVSMVEWRRTGFWANRFGRSDATPKMVFNHCSIIPEDSIIGFDDRAFSFDAGNSEYPVIWDFQGTEITNCFLADTGIALSRCENVTIANNTFEDSVGAIDLIHLEEFSNHVTVSQNVFDCKVSNINQRTRISQLDREIQPSSDIEFLNNRIIGSYNFFISAYAPRNLTVEGNDFTAASAVNTESINLSFFESRDREPIPAEVVSNNIRIVNNPGLGSSANKGFRGIFANNNANFTINGYTNAQQDIVRVNPLQAVVANGVYEIVSVQTGQKLTANSSGFGLATTNSNSQSNQWRITFNPPFSYHIQNVSNNRYLETHVGYTEFDVITNQPQDIFPFLNGVPPGGATPFWTIKRDSNGDFEIFPGGNERQSILTVNGGSPRLAFTISIDSSGTRSNLPLSEDVRWVIRPVGGQTTTTPDPVPTSNSGSLSNLALNQPSSQSSVLFGLDASFANDGNRDNLSHTESNGAAWWEVDLGGIRNIDHINIWNREECCANRLAEYQIFISDNPFSSQNIVTTVNQNGVSNFFQSDAAQRPTRQNIGRTGRYVRIQLIGTNYLHPAEIEVMGTNLGGSNLVTFEIDALEKVETIIYPNPVDLGGNLTIKGLNPGTNSQVTIINSVGQTVGVFSVANGTEIINTSSLSSGLYFVIIEGVEPQKIAVR